MTHLRSLVVVVVCAAVFAFAATLQAQPPTPTDPDNMAMGGLPGTYPTSVTATNMNVEPALPAEPTATIKTI